MRASRISRKARSNQQKIGGVFLTIDFLSLVIDRRGDIKGIKKSLLTDSDQEPFPLHNVKVPVKK